ncbi:NAD(P)/FAD-dependent oxidoreductase [Chloroflexota bacterium]
MKAKYLIIGNSAGGIGAAEAIRQVDREGSLVIVSDEPYLSYSRPLISKYLSGERDLEGMLYRYADFYEQNNIITMFDRKVNSLNLETHTAELDDGKIVWEKLLLATGGKPILPKMEGDDKNGVFSFINLNDAKAIDGFLYQAGEVVVIGGGLIGLSVTEALKKRGLNVNVVEMKDRVLNTILDEQASLMAEEAIRQAGVKVITGHIVAEVTGGERVTGVVLDDGARIPCNIVVIAIGVLPRAELALSAGIKVNRGILVDSHMRTSHPDVYSCGDAVEAYDFLYGMNRVIPIWPNAYIGGKVAGSNMAGVETEYPGGTAMNSLNYFGIDIATAGMVNPPDDECEVISTRNETSYRKIILRKDHIVGMVFVGEIEKSGMIFGLMRDQVDVGGFKQELLNSGFGLASLSREKWQERLEIPAAESAVPVGSF